MVIVVTVINVSAAASRQPLHSGIRVALSFNTLLAMNGDMREFRQPGVIQYTDTAARLS